MKRTWALTLLVSVAACLAVWAGMAAAESEQAGTELQTYFSNANTTGGQAFVNITAPLEGNLTATSPAVREGETCAMIYVFNDAQAMQACCGCPLTADSLLTLSFSGNLASNPVAAGQILHDGTIRILSRLPNAVPPSPGDSLPAYEFCDSSTSICCDPTAAPTVVDPASTDELLIGNELVAWASHIQSTQITEEELEAQNVLATGVLPNEYYDPYALPQACQDTTQLGSGQGVCTCPAGPI